MKILKTTLYTLLLSVGACASSGKTADTVSADVATVAAPSQTDKFNTDSAYRFVERQTLFGPRVPGTAEHRACGEWLARQLEQKGALVTLQELELTAFNGDKLPTRNILGQFNPEASDRTLLVAHWDTRPWADQDADAGNHAKPVLGANDGASGVGVLLEVARVLNQEGISRGVDILFVDSEDYGSEGDDESWALGARAFVENPPVKGYRPSRVILLDMVGGKGSVFRRETFSDYNAPSLLNEVWQSAAIAGYEDLFVNIPGGAITDDHVEFLKANIPAIDIIALNENGFLPTWHTTQDTMDNIDPAVLTAVGRTVLTYLYKK